MKINTITLGMESMTMTMVGWLIVHAKMCNKFITRAVARSHRSNLIITIDIECTNASNASDGV